MFFNPIFNTLPYRGKFIDNHKRRGKPLRYNLSSLRDLSVAKFLPDINNIYIAGVTCCAVRLERITGARLTCVKVEKYHNAGVPVARAARRCMRVTLWNVFGLVSGEYGRNV